MIYKTLKIRKEVCGLSNCYRLRLSASFCFTELFKYTKMKGLEQNNQNGTAKIADEPVLATVRVECSVCKKIVASKNNGYDVMSKLPRKHYENTM
jgi:hypothetical protein